MSILAKLHGLEECSMMQCAAAWLLQDARDYLLDQSTTDEQIDYYACHVGTLGHCKDLLANRPSKEVRQFLEDQIHDAQPKEGSTFTKKHGDLKGNKSAKQRAKNTGLDNASSLHTTHQLSSSSEVDVSEVEFLSFTKAALPSSVPPAPIVLTQPEIKELRVAAIGKMMKDPDHVHVRELKQVKDGLKRPYDKNLIKANELMCDMNYSIEDRLKGACNFYRAQNKVDEEKTM